AGAAEPRRPRRVRTQSLRETRAPARLAGLVANRTAGGFLDGSDEPRQLESPRGETCDAPVHAVDRATDPFHRAARAGQDPELVEELLEILGEKRLRPVGERGLGRVVHLDHEPVDARAPGRARKARHEVAPARGVRGVREEREMREGAGDEEAAEIQRATCSLLERSNAALAE